MSLSPLARVHARVRCVTLATARCATEMRVCRRWPAPPRASASQHFHKPICSPKTAVVIFPRCARISAVVVVVVVFGAITRQKADVKWRVLLVCPYASSRSPLGGIYVVCDLWRPKTTAAGQCVQRILCGIVRQHLSLTVLWCTSACVCSRPDAPNTTWPGRRPAANRRGQTFVTYA